MKRTQLYSKAVETYGISAQEDVLLEEMAELAISVLERRAKVNSVEKEGDQALKEMFYGALAILKVRRNQTVKRESGKVADEVADVEIMLEQMKQYFGIGDEVKARKRFKKERLGKRLEVRE